MQDSALLCVRQLCKHYDTAAGRLDILKAVSLLVQQGEFLAVVGESGSGKSTLLQLLGTLDLADSGEVCLQGVNVLMLKDHEKAALRNQHIGFVYQEHHLIPELTAVENVMLPLLMRGETAAKAEQQAKGILERLKLEHRLQHVPSRLSGGESQRVAVARALVTKPTLLLADEPTGNLDEATAQTVFHTLQMLAKEENTAVVMVTHSSSLAAQADRVLRLKQGVLLEA